MRKTLIVLSLALIATGVRAATLTPPSFLARRDYTGMGQWVVVADTNGDKIPDLIGNHPYAGVTVLLGNGNGTFRQGPTSNVGMKYILNFVAADMNRDGIPDLVLAGGLNGVEVPLSLIHISGGFSSAFFCGAEVSVEHPASNRSRAAAETSVNVFIGPS